MRAMKEEWSLEGNTEAEMRAKVRCPGASWRLGGQSSSSLNAGPRSTELEESGELPSALTRCLPEGSRAEVTKQGCAEPSSPCAEC